MVSNVEQMVAERLPVRVAGSKVGRTGPAGNVIAPFDRNDWCYEKKAQDHK